MGVAERYSRWTGRLADCCPPARWSTERCSTPNLCCSSTTARPSLLNSTPPLMRACVPITICSDPSARPSSVCRRGAALVLPVSMATLGTSAPAPCSLAMRSSMLRLCCAARTSVGAISATCHPHLAAASIARKATAVFPEPTSPCSSRSIGFPLQRSSRISETAFCWSPVSWNGRKARAVSTACRPSSGRVMLWEACGSMTSV
mmetsp:Transcript_10120/g.29077  ORF Transcript_10120/g.29077 Transcript_10120/m.29077 type:complete len:204 (-) Transcript_10120:1880-2491(-)